MTPLLRKDDGFLYPKDGKCPQCSRQLKDGNGIAYLSAGSLWVDDNGDSVEGISEAPAHPRAFWDIGFHGSDTDCRDSVNTCLVEDLNSDQFDFQFCSFACMRLWLNGVIDDLENRLTTGRT